jgi:acyl-CoA synthetase (AMP-forming)/AMP-acid ligase II
MRIIDLFDRSSEAFATRTCIIDSRGSLTYSEVRARSLLFARQLVSELDVKSGSRIGVLSPNCSAALIAILSILRAGAIWVPVNARATVEELALFLETAACEILLVEESLYSLGQGAVKHLRCRLVSLPELSSANRVPLSITFDQTAPSGYSMDDVCTIFGTGGTTGRVKAAMWTHRTWEVLICNFLAGVHHTENPVYLIAAPLTHAAGTLCFALIAQGSTTALLPRAEPELIMRSIEELGITTLFLPPTVIYMMLAHPRVRAFRYDTLQNLIYAAAPMSEAKLRLAVEVFGPVMVQTYGQAEAPMVCTILTKQDHLDAMRSENQHRLLSCGRPGLFSEVAVIDDEGKFLPPGKTGEIVIKGELVMAGYYNDPEETARCKIAGWHRTGDIGYRDSDGFFYITDRKRDMIITGGFNVYPSEIEQVLWSHPTVKDCAVVGAPDDKWGEAVVGVVELKAGETVTERSLIDFCKAKVGGVKAPKRVLFWPELPRSSAGKVLKREIRANLWEGFSRKI